MGDGDSSLTRAKEAMKQSSDCLQVTGEDSLHRKSSYEVDDQDYMADCTAIVASCLVIPVVGSD